MNIQRESNAPTHDHTCRCCVNARVLSVLCFVLVWLLALSARTP